MIKTDSFNEPELKRWKCHTCHYFFEDSLRVDGRCPFCGNANLYPMCPHDCECTCINDTSYALHFCPTCGKSTCPCGNHSVVTISRVTGYLADVAGFNSAKRQELKDRVRWNLGQLEEVG